MNRSGSSPAPPPPLQQVSFSSYLPPMDLFLVWSIKEELAGFSLV
jgi:hypothetical protein